MLRSEGGHTGADDVPNGTLIIAGNTAASREFELKGLRRMRPVVSNDSAL